MFLNPEKIIAKDAKASITDAGNCPSMVVSTKEGLGVIAVLYNTLTLKLR